MDERSRKTMTGIGKVDEIVDEKSKTIKLVGSGGDRIKNAQEVAALADTT